MSDDKYKVWLAYLLWFFGGFGTLGLHRFYMNKIGTGLLWIFSGGLFLVGSIVDFITMPMQVAAANRGAKQDYIVNHVANQLGWSKTVSTPPQPVNTPKDSLEKAILRTAKAHKGRVTPALVAAEADWSMDQVKKELDAFVTKRHAEIQVSRNGIVVYYFADFDDGSLTNTEGL